jgi:hypothetical protein
MPTWHYSERMRGNAEATDAGRASVRVARLLARMMDVAVTVPGTRIRIGLDPLIGLLPGFGDAVTSLVGTWVVLTAVHLGVPRVVVVRMLINVMLNGVIGSVPVLGDLFSVWYKSHLRNADLLERHLDTPGRSTAADWFFVGGLLLAALCVLAAVMWLVFAGVAWLWHQALSRVG